MWQHFQQYVKEGRAFTELLPWNIIIGTRVWKLLVKSPSTTSPHRRCCAEWGAPLTDPGYPADTSELYSWEGQKKGNINALPVRNQPANLHLLSISRLGWLDCLYGLDKHESVIWPVRISHHWLIYASYPDYPSRIPSYSGLCLRKCPQVLCELVFFFSIEPCDELNV